MITIICGNPGAGKTALLTNYLVSKMINEGFEDWLSCKRELKKLNKGGFEKLELPSQKHLCFSDYKVKVSKRIENYYIDGFQIGLPNPFFKTTFIPPFSTIYLDEAQRYYDSRMSKFLREEVYHWYQLHRHNDYNIFMACQRLGNIDLNIRALAEKFIVIDKIEIKENKYGQVVKITWTTRQFKSCEVAENYLLAKERKKINDLGEEKNITTEFNVFDYYDSKGCKPVFFEGNYDRPFDYFTEDGYQFTLDSFVRYNNVHYFTAPQGYWKNAKYDEKILAGG